MNGVLQAVIDSIGVGLGRPGRIVAQARRARPAFRAALGGLSEIRRKLPSPLTGVASAPWAWALRQGRVRPASRPSSRTRPPVTAGRAFDQLPLFRPEAMAARRTGWLGRPQVIQPWPVRAVAAGALAAAVAAVCLVALGSYTRRVNVQGVVAPTAGVIRVTAPAAGRIEALDVREGETVDEGRLLYRLVLDSITGEGATQGRVKLLLAVQKSEFETEIKRQQAVAGLRKAELTTRLTDLARQIGQIDRQIEQTGAYVDKLEKQVDSTQALNERRLIPNRDLLDRQQMLATQRQTKEVLKRDRLEREGAVHVAKAELDRADHELATKLADLRRQINELDRALTEAEARRVMHVTAGGGGQVTGIVARPGAVVRAGEPLLTIAPNAGGLVAYLFAPSEAIGFVREGALVLLRYRAYPYQKFGQYPGTVAAITRAPLGAEEIDRGVPIENQPESRAALYRITVRLDRPTVRVYDRDEPLAIGERLEASIYLEKRRIWQWIVDPLYALVHAAAAPG